MIYICIPESDIDTNNDWVRENLDPSATATFTINRKDPVTGDLYCLISIIDGYSPYCEGMKSQFSYTDYLPGYYNTKGLTEDRSVNMELTIKSTKKPGGIFGHGETFQILSTNVRDLTTSLIEIPVLKEV